MPIDKSVNDPSEMTKLIAIGNSVAFYFLFFCTSYCRPNMAAMRTVDTSSESRVPQCANI